jgi:hypothetical protein
VSSPTVAYEEFVIEWARLMSLESRRHETPGQILMATLAELNPQAHDHIVGTDNDPNRDDSRIRAALAVARLNWHGR